MKSIKRKLALGTAIAFLGIFAVETIAVAASDIMPEIVVTKSDCGGDKDDEC